MNNKHNYNITNIPKTLLILKTTD